MTKTCKYCKQSKPINQFIKVLSWRRKCCKNCYQLPFLEQQRKKDEEAIQKREKYCEKYEKYERERHPQWSLFRNAKGRSKRYNLPFTLKIEDIVIPEFCPVLGIKLRKASGKMDDFSPTLDRLNPKLGYTKENICVMSNRANRMKSNGSIEEHEKVAKFMRDRGLTIIESVV